MDLSFSTRVLILVALYAAWQHRAAGIALARQLACKCRMSRSQVFTWGKRALLAVAVGLFLFGGNLPSIDWPVNIIPTPAPDVTAPSAEMQTLVAPVKAALADASSDDKQTISAFYLDFAAAIEGKEYSTEQFRTAHISAGKAVFDTRLKGKYAGLADAVNKALADGVGLTQGPLDTPRAVETLKAIAWAAVQ